MVDLNLEDDFFDLKNLDEQVDLETLRIYRQNFSNRQPAHVLNNLDAVEFLEQLGGYATDRSSGNSGLTTAGLLMFGKLRSILDAIPRYVVDYQERPRAVKEARWIDRLTTDFSWSGNLYGKNWRAPDIEERIETDQTILALRMVSLMPEESVEYLRKQIGKAFDHLSQSERIALVTAHAEGCISHARLTELTKEHPSDLTHILHGLVAKGILQSEGKSTATFYFLPGAHPIESSGAKEVFGLNVFSHQAEAKGMSSGHKEVSSGYKEESSGHSEVLQEHIEILRSIATPVASAQRAPKDLVVSTILQLCQGRYLSLAELADLLKRDPDTLRKNFIRVMLADQQLLAEHPNITTHPKQRYIRAEPQVEESI
jgi:DNA-binding MarR family transcriptional regulator